MFLIDAFKEYVQAGGKNKLRLKGPAEHGYEKALHDRIREHKLDHFVSVLAPSYGDDKWKFLGQAQAVIYPCVDEPFGRVPFEAVLAGSVPVLPIESGGAEYLEKVLPECTYQDTNPAALAEALALFDRKDASQDEIFKQARLRLREELSPEAIAQRFVETYREVAGSRS